MYESKRSGRNKHSMTDKLANLGWKKTVP
jgi:hypothetical protein